MRAKLGPVWALIALWIMAVDPANVFPSRLDLGANRLDALLPSCRPCLVV